MTILVADDESESRQLLVDILKAEGYEVRPADDGQLALASIMAQPPDLILLDIRMPDMDGFEVCRRLKSRAATEEIPVIFISASGELEEKVEGLRLGAVDYVTKPFQREELLARVRTHLELGRLRAHLEMQVAERTAELRESEERFRNMADAAPVMIWASGPDKLFTFFNRVWLEFTGRCLDEELCRSWAESVHADDSEWCLTTYSSSFDARRSFTMEYRLRRADGEYRWILNKGVPRFAPGGIFQGYVGSSTDITDLKQAHEKMLASHKIESLGLMAAGVAHDFGNLLGVILGEVNLARSEMSPKARGRENIERIEAATTHATGLIKMLMTSAGVGGSSDVSGSVNISFLVKQTLGLLMGSISKRAELRRNLANDLPAVRGNSTELQQVIMNLVTNAMEALGGQHGVITVSTARVHLPEGSADGPWANVADGEYVLLTVADTGCGMTAETRARIFDQFFTTKTQGKGLGLSVVHGIIRSHGGAINVRSTPRKGTTFEVLLPCVIANVNSLASARVGPNARPNRDRPG